MAGNNWNPNSPSIVGLEWLADTYGQWDLPGAGPWAQRVRSRSAQTINKLRFMLPFSWTSPFGSNYTPLAGSSVGGQDQILIEVIPAGSEIITNPVTSVTYQPSADQAKGAGWLDQGGGAANIYLSIDEGIASEDANYVHNASGAQQDYDVRVASAAFPAGARVLKIKVRILVNRASVGASFDVGVVKVASTNFYRTPNHTVYVPYFTDLNASRLTEMDLGEINPETKVPWTPTDVIGFSNGTWAIRIRNVAGNPDVQVSALEMVVTYQTTENRVAAACLTGTAGSTQAAGAVETTQFVGLPAAGASWAKPASGDFALVFRRPFAPLVTWAPQTGFTIAWVSSVLSGVEQACSVPGVVSALPSLDAYGQITACDFTAAGKGRTAPVLMITSAPAVSDDSLPYFLTNDTTHFVGINNAQAVTQKFTSPAASTFQILKILLLPGAATQNLIIKVKRNSDNVQFGNTITVTPAEVAALATEANGFHLYRNAAIGAALANGTQYYIELTTTDVTALGSGWETILVGDDALGIVFLGGPASFGGTTDLATVNAVSKTHFDIPATLATIPATPAGLTSTVTSIALTGDAGRCGVPNIKVARLAWTATVLGATFTRYEVQRSEDLGVTWRTIAYGLTESHVTFDDYEAPRTVNVQYRIRVIRSDGAESAYTAATAGVTLFPTGCEVLFVSNEQPTYALGYNREPTLEFGFIAPQRDQLLEIYGADYAVAFMEAEDPGVQTTMELTVNFGTVPTADDISIFSPLRRISRAAISYVCVLDWTGSRWFAHLQFPKGVWSEPGFVYHAEVTLTEISGVPSIAVF